MASLFFFGGDQIQSQAVLIHPFFFTVCITERTTIMGFKMTIAAPQELLDSTQFQSATKVTQDNLVLFCTVVLMYGGVDTLDRQYQQIGWERLSKFIRDKTISKTKALVIESGVVQCDGVYSSRKPGREKSFGYRFGPNVSAANFVVYEVQAKWTRDRIKRIESQRRVPSMHVKGKLEPVHQRLVEMMNSFQLDVEDAQRVIGGLPVYKRPSAETQFLSFYSKQFFAVVGATGRFYSNISNLRKELRSVLLADVGGELKATVTPDVSNSQPLCLNYFLKGHISQSELNKHLEWTETGQLYSVIANDLGLTRNQVKASFVKYLCGPWFEDEPFICPSHLECDELRVKHETLTAIGRWYQECLPEVAAYLKREKSNQVYVKQLNVNRSTGKPKQAYAIIANRLQDFEAQVVVRDCCGQLLQKAPELVMSTIHDGILVPAEFSELVIQELRSSFEAQGLSPEITTGQEQQKNYIEIYRDKTKDKEVTQQTKDTERTTHIEETPIRLALLRPVHPFHQPNF